MKWHGRHTVVRYVRASFDKLCEGTYYYYQERRNIGRYWIKKIVPQSQVLSKLLLSMQRLGDGCTRSGSMSGDVCIGMAVGWGRRLKRPVY